MRILATSDLHRGCSTKRAPHIDVLIFGHTHKAVDQVVEGVRVVNAGGDYDKPRAVIIEVPDAIP